MSFSYMAVTAVALIGLISWLNCLLLSRLFSMYHRKAVRHSYLLITGAAVLITYFSRVRQPSYTAAGHEIYYVLVYGALAWLCGQFVLIILQLLLYAVSKCIHWLSRTGPAAETQSSGGGMTRRTFLHSAAVAMPLVSVGIGAQGIYQAQTGMALRQHTLRFSGLPSYLQGFTIGQISDTHLGPYFSLERFDAALQLLKQQKPDLLVMTGDLADDLSLLRPALDRLNALQPLIPRGIYFCLGNHEYLRNVDFVRAEVAKSSVVLLENSNALIAPGAQPVYLMGVDYPGSDTAHSGLNISVSRRLQCFAAAQQNIPDQAFKVLIAHHPDFLFDGFAAGIPLTLAGHTHGGQVVLLGKPLFYSHQYVRGLFQENGVYGYVSSGAGHWFPFRLNCPPEVSTFTFQA